MLRGFLAVHATRSSSGVGPRSPRERDNRRRRKPEWCDNFTPDPFSSQLVTSLTRPSERFHSTGIRRSPNVFLSRMLTRNIRNEEDVIDQRGVVRRRSESMPCRNCLSQPEAVKVRADNLVALACGLFELLPLQHPNSSVPSPDESAVL